MNNFALLLQRGDAWLFISNAILFGALHGLEPGHLKTMMAAFIVAVRETLKQAVLLRLAATISHMTMVWLTAMAGLWPGHGWNAQASEPWFRLISRAAIVLTACWMLWHTWCESQPHAHHDHHHEHSHHHEHEHHHKRSHHHEHDHHHEHASSSVAPLMAEEWQDVHQRAHAQEINRCSDGRQVTIGQIVLFGLTGGLIPCPASITVLLICLQLKKFSLDATLVLGPSVGLALTLVASGAITALSLKQATHRWPWLNDVSRRASRFSGLLIIVVEIYMVFHDLSGL